uniref:Uncharacterized protein n=1 Tax=Neobodo designis TaxID=312471 RepID=A0A7S1M1H9_NEODS|mmetsp:Transcript_32415/g.100267  ORF Transcript_32415/g.100267 Transcript_32415/m.100267 type:complete len:275 (+) Transcript_32415:101-925(+)
MPPGQFKAQRQQAKRDNVIPGMKSLHRGIHHHENKEQVDRFMTHTGRKRNDFRELLVHHQKINEELKDVYARTAALVKDDMTMEERKEASWRAFERIGGKRPKEKVKYAAHLAKVSAEKKKDRSRAEEERLTGGETINIAEGSAAEKLRKKRVGRFVKDQVDRAKMLKRVGDPSNTLGGVGHFDRGSNMLQLRNKTERSVRRAVAHDKRVSAVKDRRKGGRTMWDTNAFDVNKRADGYVRDSSRDYDLGRSRGGGGGGRGRGGAGKRGGRGRGR